MMDKEYSSIVRRKIQFILDYIGIRHEVSKAGGLRFFLGAVVIKVRHIECKYKCSERHFKFVLESDRCKNGTVSCTGREASFASNFVKAVKTMADRVGYVINCNLALIDTTYLQAMMYRLEYRGLSGVR